MGNVGDIRAGLVGIRARLATEQQVITLAMRQLDSAHTRLTMVSAGSGNADLHQAATQAHSAGDDVLDALRHIDFADRYLSDYIADAL